jgi:hypothetical protein
MKVISIVLCQCRQHSGVPVDSLIDASAVNLTKSQIRTSVLKLPSLLQYSVENNLRPKVKYLKEEIGISQTNLTEMVVKNPTLLGVSLHQRIAVTTEGLRHLCGMSNEDIGSVLVRVPQLLSLNWKTNVKRKIEFFTDRLDLSQSTLRSLLLLAPRVLMHSIDLSLEPKMRTLERAAMSSGEALAVVQTNPSLLLSSISTLERRISSFLESNNTFQESFSSRQTLEEKEMNPRSRTKRSVMELSGNSVVDVLPDVVVAAAKIGTSRANMYNIIKTGRSYKGKTYAYGVVGDTDKRSSLPPPSSDGGTVPTANERLYEDFGRNFVPGHTRVRLFETLRSSSPKRPKDTQVKNDRLYMQAFVCARTYPPERADQVRGRQQSGGLSIHFPQLCGSYIGGNLLRSAAEKCFGNQIISTPEGGTRFCDGRIALGYVYSKPSRNRCSLYVCRDVLRVVAELLKLESTCPDLLNSCIDIDIFTDSNYAWTLLNNNTSLLRWGSYARKDDFVYDGEMEKWKANTDILYPLSRTFYRVVNQDLLPTLDSPKSYAKELTVRFRHQSEIDLSGTSLAGMILPGKQAEQAAAWYYERGQKFLM